MKVVDASVAAKWLFVEPYSEEALALASTTYSTGDQLAGPNLLSTEIANVVLRRLRRGEVTPADASLLFDEFIRMRISFRAPRNLSREALNVAIEHRLSAVYDAHYVALAKMLGCDFWTADERIVRTLSVALPFVKWIGSYPNGMLSPG